MRSALISLNPDWFDEQAMKNFLDDEILDTEDPNYYKNFNVLTIEIKATLKQIKELFKATTNFVLIDGCPVFRAAVSAAAQLLEMVLIDVNPVNSKKLDDFEIGPSRSKRLIDLCKVAYKVHYKDCQTNTSTVLSPENCVAVSNL